MSTSSTLACKTEKERKVKVGISVRFFNLHQDCRMFLIPQTNDPSLPGFHKRIASFLFDTLFHLTEMTFYVVELMHS